MGLSRGRPPGCGNGAPCGSAASPVEGTVVDGTGVPNDGAAGRLPVAATSRGGNSRITVSEPLRGPSDAVRRSTARSVSSPSTAAPTRYGRAGFPSMAIRATPPLIDDPAFGAATPIRRNRLAAAGAAATVVVLGETLVPNKRERSPRKARASPAGAAFDGAAGDRTQKAHRPEGDAQPHDGPDHES